MPDPASDRTLRVVALLVIGSASACAIDGTTSNDPADPEVTAGVVAASPHLHLAAQRNLFERYLFETELLKEDVRQFDVWLEAQKRPSLGGGVPTDHERLLRVLRDAEEAAAQISDVELRCRMESDVLGVLAALAKSPCIVELLQQQRDEMERLTFAVELLREDVRREPDLRAEYRYTHGMGPIRTPVVERIARARESARLLEGRVVDPRLASDLDRTLAALDELESAASASAAESQAETPKSLEEQREILEMLRFDLELLNEDVKELQRFLAVQSRFSSAVPRGLDVRERYERLRTKATQFARVVSEPLLAQDLKADILDALDELTKSPLFAQR